MSFEENEKIEENVKYVFTNDAGNSTDSELLQARFENVFEYVLKLSLQKD